MKHLRRQSPRPITIRNRVIGGADPLICLPLSGSEPAALLTQAEETAAMRPDLVEWRADRIESLDDANAVGRLLAELRTTLGEIPLIFTCRSLAEGGFRPIDNDHRLRLYRQAAASGLVDLVDAEISSGRPWIHTLAQHCRNAGVALILSYHNFETTPDEPYLLDRLIEAQALGADIAKVAVMPAGFRDVLTLLGATSRARSTHVQIPMITMAMEAHGALSRIVGSLFGSDVTFAFGVVGSASGQVPIETLRKAWEVLGIRSHSTDAKR